MIFFGACKGKTTMEENEEDSIARTTLDIKNDSMIYGLACDGTTDSFVVIWPFGGDPITYNIIEAKANGMVIGKPSIGDWTGIMVNPDDTTEATVVINLDALKGTWCYPVMPVMKDLQHMSKRMQQRMMSDMPDSVKNTYMVPREYGFTLKRSHVAQPVGRIMRSNTLEDDSPVQYPEVRNYKEWYVVNGKLLLVSGMRTLPGMKGNEAKKQPDIIDTLEFVYMDNDSLILKHHGTTYGFHRRANAMAANAKATTAAQQQDKMK